MKLNVSNELHCYQLNEIKMYQTLTMADRTFSV